MTRILGIETSCDETSAAVLRDDGPGGVVACESLVILSQDVHAVFGGVVPEIASRAHLASIVPVVDRALSDAGAMLGDLDAIAVTTGPGLVGALLVGVSYGKALAFGSDRALVGVHHMEGHLFATSLESPEAVPPFTALLVSGGHTMLLDVPSWGEYRLLGATRDDAAGEAFDKVAKLLGLPYPGGRHLEALAREAPERDGAGQSTRVRFSRPMLRGNQRPGDDDYYAFSFSGLKTAVLRTVRESANLDADRATIARAFQDALVESLAEKTRRAVEAYDRPRVVLGGGVACNRALLDALRERLEPRGIAVHAPSARLATDNAAMIARAGLFRLARGELAGPGLNAYASLPLPGLRAA